MTDIMALHARFAIAESLIDDHAIRTLQQRYFHACDTENWADLKQILTPGAIFDFREAIDLELPPIVGSDAIIDFISRSMASITSAHRGYLRTLDFADNDHATAIWAMEDIAVDRSPGQSSQVDE